MATSLSTAAPPGAQNSPNMPQGPWGGSATMQSPNLPAHPRGPGARADTTSSFASRSLPPAEGSIPQQLNGIHHPPPTAPSPQNVTPTHPPASHSPFLPQFTQRHPSQDASANAPQQHSKAPAGLIRSDTGPGTQPATDKSHTEQYTVIADAIKSADPSILRQAVRDHWDACLLGSDYNLAFFTNAILHQAPDDVLRRSVQEFGGRLVKAALPQIISRCSPVNFDQMTDLVLSKLSPQFLDRALARRLETIDARSLVNALARAERLGYDVSDIVVERLPDKPEQVVPSLQGVIPPDFPSSNEQHSGHPTQQQPMQGNKMTPAPVPAPAPNHPKSRQIDWMAGLPPLPSEGPGGIQYCNDCRRPCSGQLALQYHQKKRCCDLSFRLQNIGRNLCPHCGLTFTSNTGLLYHTKVGVCGHYSDETNKIMAAELQAYVHHRNTRIAMPQAASTHISAETPQKFAGVKAAVHQVAGQHDTFHSQAQSTPPSQSASQPRSARKDDAAYAHLNPEAFQKLQADLAKAEEKYGKLMREALTMPEPDRSNNMAKWKNCYNTKQSMTRKKYGIRLREKRTQDEIDAERRRLLGDNGPEKWLEMERSAKRPRTDGGPSSQTASPLPTSSSAPQPDQSLTPRKRVALADMGGLSGSVGSAEMTDPTTLLKSSEPRGLVHLQQSQGQSQVNESQALPLGSKQDEPMTIAEDSSSGSFTTNKEQMAEDDMSTSSDDDGSNGDIPAR